MEEDIERANILLVDDRQENLLVLENVLAPLSQNLVKATSGTEALKQLLERDFAVILLDVQMPEVDGFETASMIRARERTQNTPIIFITAINTDDDYVFQGYRMGAVDYLFKPIVPEVLRAKVAAFVDLHQKTHQLAQQSEQLKTTVENLEREMLARRRAEKALRRAYDELELRVEERTADLARANERLAFLANASTALTTSLDDRAILQTLARLAIPLLCDLCVIDLLEEDVSLRHVVGAAAQPDVEAQLQRLLARYPRSIGAGQPGAEVLAGQRASHFPIEDDDDLALLSEDQAEREVMRGLQISSVLAVPLIARGTSFGVVWLAFAESGRTHGPEDRGLAEELVRRAAVAVDNARLYQQAQQALRLRDQFLSLAAHELKTPMTTILGAAQLIDRLVAKGPTTTERERRLSSTLVEQVLRLRRLIGSLLDLTHMQEGRFQIERTVVDLNAVTRQLVEELRPTLSIHTLDLDCPDCPVLIEGDRLRLEQVFQNVLQNAVKYSPEGGRVTVGLALDGHQARMIIADEGIGIPPESLPKIFERFYRAPNVNIQQLSGMGVGLYVVREILALHGGSIEAQSGEGPGSTFTIYLPLMSDQKAEARRGEEQQA